MLLLLVVFVFVLLQFRSLQLSMPAPYPPSNVYTRRWTHISRTLKRAYKYSLVYHYICVDIDRFRQIQLKITLKYHCVCMLSSKGLQSSFAIINLNKSLFRMMIDSYSNKKAQTCWCVLRYRHSLACIT